MALLFTQILFPFISQIEHEQTSHRIITKVLKCVNDSAINQSFLPCCHRHTGIATQAVTSNWLWYELKKRLVLVHLKQIIKVIFESCIERLLKHWCKSRNYGQSMKQLSNTFFTKWTETFSEWSSFYFIKGINLRPSDHKKRTRYGRPFFAVALLNDISLLDEFVLGLLGHCT